jgi:SAM-dependent MidA family methyltransferase
MKMLTEVIRREIVEQGGVLPFIRFMELALYCPNLGYYETKKDNVGRHGDFYTSVSVGDLFGQLLAFQFAEWLQEPANAGLRIVEVGAHDGQLAKDILTWLQSNRPHLFGRIKYCIIEPSRRRQEWQRESLKSFDGRVDWLSGFGDLNPSRLNGVIFSNELLDAFPIHRLGWDAQKKKWFEWGVAANGDSFEWSKIEKFSNGLSTLVPNLPSSLLEVLPDDFTIEINSAARDWWRLAATSLNSGKLMTIDYGLPGDEFFLPSRKNGTLRAFFKHHFADDLLANPGEQDLTAHVNFSEIQKTGEEAGLSTNLFSTQGNFLTQILEKTLKGKNFGEWTSARGRQFQTLTHPEHLGRSFRVLIQSR